MIGLLHHVRHNLVAYLALFVALGGTSVAASNVLVPRNSVGTAQLLRGAVTKPKISKKTLVALKGNRGPAGSAVAYARIDEDGSVDPALSKGIVNANVSHPAVGFYCLSGLPFTPHNAMVTPQVFVENAGAFINQGMKAGSCPASAQVTVAITQDGGANTDTFVNYPFMIAIN
jgi:hypothetical protein